MLLTHVGWMHSSGRITQKCEIYVAMRRMRFTGAQESLLTVDCTPRSLRHETQRNATRKHMGSRGDGEMATIQRQNDCFI